ncbi:hypothetical protein HYDPIDRAFT_24902 [Hydnomerulius pinastri MD-312]|nr:hypothetical protein HYDPIDRAFT_24902 [Hydnomerulius pinastri MD-312]
MFAAISHRNCRTPTELQLRYINSANGDQSGTWRHYGHYPANNNNNVFEHLPTLHVCTHPPTHLAFVAYLFPPSPIPMAALTMTSMRSQLGTASPYVSSPLAGSTHSSVAAPSRSIPKRSSSFGQSRPLRPFASISQNAMSSSKKPVKLIEPPKNFKTTFILDLTQGEFSRQD